VNELHRDRREEREVQEPRAELKHERDGDDPRRTNDAR
jgi:hypothetical protein